MVSRSVRLLITISEDDDKWLEDLVSKKVFFTKSEAVRAAIRLLRQKIEQYERGG